MPRNKPHTARREPIPAEPEANMKKRFEVGKQYEPYQTEFEAVTVIRRTEKTVRVRTSQAEWSMRIKTDADGNEYAVDSTVPRKWRDAFTYTA